MNQDEISKYWWRILKALPFDGGPSSTRWMFLLAGTTVSFVLLLMGICFCWVYLHKPEAATMAIMSAAIAATVTALFGFASNAQNKKNAQSSDSSSIDSPPAAPQNPVQENKQ